MKEGKLLIHVDYSENYKSEQQNEITTGFYGQSQFRLFRVAIYTKEDNSVVCKNYALVTPENVHSCNISLGLNNIFLFTIQADIDITSAKF